MTEIQIKLLRENAKIPAFATSGAAGVDLVAVLPERLEIKPGQTAFVPTGLAMAIPSGLFGMIVARSGIACKRGLAPANKVGIIDSDYRGEIMVALHNHGTESQYVDAGERIAQMLFVPYVQPTLTVVDELDETARGAGGFGSTGRA